MGDKVFVFDQQPRFLLNEVIKLRTKAKVIISPSDQLDQHNAPIKDLELVCYIGTITLEMVKNENGKKEPRIIYVLADIDTHLKFETISEEKLMERIII